MICLFDLVSVELIIIACNTVKDSQEAESIPTQQQHGKGQPYEPRSRAEGEVEEDEERPTAAYYDGGPAWTGSQMDDEA